MIFRDKNRDQRVAAKKNEQVQDNFGALSDEAKELRRLSIILELSKKLSSATDLQTLLVDVVDSAVEITGAERGFLMLMENPMLLDHRLYDPVITPPPHAAPKIEFRVARSAAKKDLHQEHFKISMTIAYQVADSMQPVWVRDAQSEQRLKTSDSVTNLDLRTILCVPLKLETRILGVIYVDSRFIMRTFTEEDLLMFEALAEHASVAISKARLYEELLQKAKIEQENQELRRLDRKKSDFISMLSHEFRTPLTVIQGYAERLKAGKVVETSQVQGQANIIFEESRRLARMVENLLDISRIQSGREKIARVETDLVEIIEKAVNFLKPKAEAKHINLTYTITKRPVVISLDTDKIYQVMINLIDNAIKYTAERGAVDVVADEIPTLEVQGDVFVAGFVQVSVKDNGIGIAQVDKERVFDEFYRTGSAVSSKEQGTGLGLSICRGIVQAHGGRIWLNSEPGKGSTFTFTIPNYQPIEKLSEFKLMRR